MRKFTTCFGETFDLDDSETYRHLPDNKKALDNMMFRQIGYVLTYMDFFHPKIFPKRKRKPRFVSMFKGRFDANNCSYYQRLRIYKMIKKFADNRTKRYNDKQWLKEQIFLFQCETENMC